MWAFRGLTLLVLLIANGQAASAAVRRAVIIGINHYAANPSTDRTTDLEGASADAEQMAHMLITLHEFDSRDILLIKDQQATRERILSAINEHLIGPAKPGDLSVFYYAGHGSYVDNPDSQELDHRDETIVPADTNLGAADIRDKELAPLFNRVLDRQAGLVAIFDSCHSGSIARGLPSVSKVRYAPPIRSRAVHGSSVVADAVKSPEERGALILSATQDQQPAQEKRVRGQPRGRFTSALEQVLSGPSRDDSAEQIFLQVRALMQGGGSVQEPALAGTLARRAQPFWGLSGPLRRGGNEVRIAVSRVAGTTIHLQGGLAAGLGARALLLAGQGTPPVRLRVSEVTGMSTSVAEVVAGEVANIKLGELFRVEDFGVPSIDALRVYTPAAVPTRAELQETLAALHKLAVNRSLRWVEDPTETTPTHVILWQDKEWVVRAAAGELIPLGAPLLPKRLLRVLDRAPAAKVFVALPLPGEDRALLVTQTGVGAGRSLIELTSDAASADYWLVGRLAGAAAEFGWLMPEALRADRQRLLPARSSWIADTKEVLVEQLWTDAQILGRIKIWQNLRAPGDNRSFPYRLAMKAKDTSQVLSAGAPVLLGHIYQLVLVADELSSQVRPRYVYVFNIDSDGNSSLLVPAADRGNVENLVPDQRDGGPPPRTIPIGPEFQVTPPLGRETLVLLTSASAIPNPNVFAFRARRRTGVSPDPGTDPLSRFLFGINTNTRASQSIPASWSVQRLPVESVQE